MLQANGWARQKVNVGKLYRKSELSREMGGMELGTCTVCGVRFDGYTKRYEAVSDCVTVL